MRTITDRAVELTTDAEVTAEARFNDHLDEGHPIALSARLALNRMIAEGEWPSDSFVEWLSQGTCRRWGRRVMARPLAGRR